MSSLSEVKVVNNQNQSIHEERNEMEKYKSENTQLCVNACEIPHESLDDRNNIYTIENHSIKFSKLDGSTGFEIQLKDLVDNWLDMLEPLQLNKIENDEKLKIEKREINLYRKREEERKVNDKIRNIKSRLKPFLQECIFRAFNERNLKCDRKNIRSIIKECKNNRKYQKGIEGYNPFDILFSKNEWFLFINECNKIYLHIDAPKRKVGVFDEFHDWESSDRFSAILRELRDEPLREWKSRMEEWRNNGCINSMFSHLTSE